MKLYFLISAIFPFALWALPSGLDVQSGNVTCQSFEKHLHIDNSHKAVLHWQDFSIAKEESVHFNATALNRVTGKNCSQLMGKLSSDGMVFLINPNGIHIGSHASIDTAGFIASTAEISNENFLGNGELFFHSPSDGEIVNQGRIHCPQGDIFLIAKTIRNEGMLSSDYVGLLSAQEVFIQPFDNEKILIKAARADGQIENTGVIEALAIDLQTTSAYEKAICHTGYIEAKTPRIENGRVYLVAENGGVQVDGSIVSNEVRILGQEVELKEHAFIDVSGPEGGTILIGGDYQGANENILNAQNVSIDHGARIHADGTEGDAGTIITWADFGTYAHGDYSACALGKQGKGGFIEISGKEELAVSSHPKLFGANGAYGSLLLDPGFMKITSGGNIAPIAPFSTVFDGWINSQLAGGHLTLCTGGVGCDVTSTSGGSEFLDVDGLASISWSQPTKLTLRGKDRIQMLPGSSISATNGGEIELDGSFAGSQEGARIQGTLSTDTGNITIVGKTGSNNDSGVLLFGGTDITTVSGRISITGEGRVASGNIDGIRLNGGARIESTGVGNVGEIIMDGTINPSVPTAVNAKDGIDIRGGSRITSVDANITLIGISNVAGNSCDGIGLGQSSIVESTGRGSIRLEGFSGVGIGSSAGVRLNQVSTRSNTGKIIIEGHSRSSGGVGVTINNSGRVESLGNGEIEVRGFGFTSGLNNCLGINITNASSRVSSGGDIYLEGHGGGSGIDNHGIYILASADVIGGNCTLYGTASQVGAGSSSGIIISGTGSTVTSSSGNIDITALGGLNAGDDNHGLYIFSSGVVSATDGNVTINGTKGAGANSYGIFVENMGSQVDVSNGNAWLISNDDIRFGPNGEAMSSMGDLTLVVDNSFPVSPGIGPGRFIFDTNANLTSDGELRIYTARRSQNIISEMINGLAFTPGPFDVDSSTETWGTFYPDGAYGGLAFNFYYKEGTPSSETDLTQAQQGMFFVGVAANLVQLSDLLPILTQKLSPFRFPSYHFRLCTEEDVIESCAPTLSPYGSFIFEDDLWWVIQNP